MPIALLAVAAGCGGGGGRGDGGPPEVTGRVVSKTEARYCLTPDRGETTRCVPAGAADGVVEVGQCVTATLPAEGRAARLQVVDDAACAEGDLGDG